MARDDLDGLAEALQSVQAWLDAAARGWLLADDATLDALELDMETAHETGSEERLLDALRGTFAAFSRNPEDGTELALKALIDFMPIGLAAQLRAHVDDKRLIRSGGRGNRQRRSALPEARDAARVDGLLKAGMEPNVEAACKRVAAVFKDRWQGDWRRLKNKRNHLQKLNHLHKHHGQADTYRHWLGVFSAS